MRKNCRAVHELRCATTARQRPSLSEPSPELRQREQRVVAAARVAGSTNDSARLELQQCVGRQIQCTSEVYFPPWEQQGATPGLLESGARSANCRDVFRFIVTHLGVPGALQLSVPGGCHMCQWTRDTRTPRDCVVMSTIDILLLHSISCQIDT